MKRETCLILLMVVLLFPLLFLGSSTALPSQDVDGGLGLAVAGEGSGAYYFGVLNQTIQSSFTIINVGSIAANCTIAAVQSEGPLSALEISPASFVPLILYPQESTRVYFVVRFLLNTTGLMSVDWTVYGEGEEHTSEGTNRLSVAVVARSYFQILGRAGVLSVEVFDQNNQEYNGLTLRIKRDWLTYCNKSTRNGQATFLLSVPANYSISVYRENVEVYHHKFKMTGDMRLKVLVERLSIPIPPDYSMYIVILVLGVAIGWSGKWISDRAHERYRFRKAKIKLSPQEKEMWDWATQEVEYS